MPKKNWHKNLARYSSLAFEMLAAIGIGVWGGWEMDAWLDTSPLFLLIFSCLGFAASLVIVVKSLPRD